MAELINLNKVRKTRAKQQRTIDAEQNRILHGMSGHLKRNAQANQKSEAQRLENKRIEPSGDEENS